MVRLSTYQQNITYISQDIRTITPPSICTNLGLGETFRPSVKYGGERVSIIESTESFTVTSVLS